MTDAAYRVLARKYRPTTFDELVGQDALVRTLTNALASGRVAHAFLLTGVRGVGKTTTARILARALNCVGPDGQGGPTPTPCGRCEPCRAIVEDRHVDVLEMDAASRTGIDDIREIIDGVRYRPVAARCKVYIIDEVHMLSKQAFNGLLKTLEEPPPDVKFIFATTEVQKVPVTVLSRCQRFSLPRVPPDTLAAHYAAICRQEEVGAEPAALALVARAADGSVRDGLSILDQAIALAGPGGIVTEAALRDMLGIADRGRIFDLFEAAMRGEAAAALGTLAGLFRDGADPLLVMQDVLEIAHLVTRLKVVPAAGEGDPLVEGDRPRAAALAAALPMPVLVRAWQLLLKAVGEVQTAPIPLQAAEMALVRLAYAADLPDPGELVRILAPDGVLPKREPAARSERGDGRPATSSAPRPPLAAVTPPRYAEASPAPPRDGAAVAVALETPAATPAHLPRGLPDVLALCEEHREAVLRQQIWGYVRLVRFQPGLIEMNLGNAAPSGLANRLQAKLSEWTGTRWAVIVSQAAGEPTLKEAAELRLAALRAEAAAHPLVREILEIFPGATIERIRELDVIDASGDPQGEGDETGEGGMTP